MARMLNALGDAMQERPRLPRFLVIIVDKDIMGDFDMFDEENFNPKKDFLKVLTWFSKQVNLEIKRKRLDISEKKPGAVYGEHPTVIYVKTIRRPTYYPPSSKIGRICANRLRFNEAMNVVTRNNEQLIMNVNNCNQESDFNNLGNPTQGGKGILAAGG